ncbi:bifunctional proline dehydrogenase/L-glutamate gamma-semialdehyde dehydrogenase PutA [Jannaschia sp. LMIT008]|uniref:bifunctional proline dehydrogenase/L-glutamate gamma-semialdehyde dehydrogenase PutA n=1 Tax=Jannaschia maritima TaxID=3032585 RepID=UPI0028119CA2|nr:bifunctional proline dehydrogenase/L-glutamate gamma-semialdehyde dehydrogenase PutA [Jannaschia sp. LMIT008]
MKDHTAADPRDRMAHLHRAFEAPLVDRLAAATGLGEAERAAIVATAADWVDTIRAGGELGLMESVLVEYGLSTDEGVALMTLAEAMLRVPDAPTADALVADKIGSGDWALHMGHSASTLVNGSTLGLALTGQVLRRDRAEGLMRRATSRLGAPVIRTATRAAMRQMGRQFVLGQTIEDALDRAAASEAKGFAHSYDMLGEAAITDADADGFRRAYATAIDAIAGHAKGRAIRDAPGISIKLSALHPRYEWAQRDAVMRELVPHVTALARQAAAAGLGLNVDAEEQDRLVLSLDVIEAVLADPGLAGWDGFGIVVQAYGKRALATIDWIHDLAADLDRRVMVRLVKGAYWDAEVKHAQVEGLDGFPVFTAKAASDVSYLACARRLLDRTDRLYPQFATHNAHTIAAVLRMVGNAPKDAFELQRLHGMGEAVHDHVAATRGTRTRIYAPVGRHRELLAYLVRRLLENGANTSFVNRLADGAVPAAEVVADPFPRRHDRTDVAHPSDLFAPRDNAAGWDLNDGGALDALDDARAPHRTATWVAAPVLAGNGTAGSAVPLPSPADPADVVGHVRDGDAATAAAALDHARPWDAPPKARAKVLREAADAYEDAAPELFAMLAREAGKTLPDAVAELREAVDFLRYYADEIVRIDPKGTRAPRGTVVAISPWNFPLAIFTGQIAAALAAGNAIIAKPAEATPLIAARATQLLHGAGVPRTALQLVPGPGASVGATLSSDPRVAGVVFTGSTATAQTIHRTMANHLDPQAMLIAETGGLNAMVVDSTALPEQVVRDLLASAFQSAGQRCSACRILYVQADVAEGVLTMLRGAMDRLVHGDPWDRSTDIGPLIDARARDAFTAYVGAARTEGRVIHERRFDGPGHAFGPVLIRVPGIEAMEREVFGPVLHVATFPAGGIDGVIDAVNARGYGLTLGVHTRIGDAAGRAVARAHVGNVYVNRNQIGAIVGSQPFGGEGLSGTGPKAGGPAYVERFLRPVAADPTAPADAILAGPTGERNVLRHHPRAPILCLGPDAAAQAAAVRAVGGSATIPDGPVDLTTIEDIGGAMYDGNDGRAHRRALAARDGPILPLLRRGEAAMAVVERHECTDTTAAGGNATLLAGD